MKNGYPREQIFYMINSRGFRYVEVPLTIRTPGTVSLSLLKQNFDLYAKRISTELEKASLTPVAFSFDVDIASSSYEIGEKNVLEYFRLAVDLTRYFETPVLSIRRVASGGTDRNRVMDTVGKLYRIASKGGVRLALRTWMGTFLEDLDSVLDVVQSFSGLGLTFDPGTYIVKGMDYEQYRVLLPYVYHVVVRDSDIGIDHYQVEFGKGRVPFTKIIDDLIEMGFDGPFSIEYFKLERLNFAYYKGDPVQDTLKAKAFLESAINKRLSSR